MQQLCSLHLSTATSWRGGENQIFQLARGLLQRGQRAHILAPAGAPLLERARGAGIPATPLRLRKEWDLLGIGALLRFLRAHRPDVLHLHDGHAVLPGNLAGRFSLKGQSGKKLCTIAHRRTVFPVKSRWKYARGVDRVVAISAAVREELLKAGVPDAQIRVVYSGVEFPAPDAAARQGFRAQHGIPLDALMIGHAAALSSEKRQADILAAFGKCLNGTKGGGARNVYLCLAGTGREDDNLRRISTGLKLDDRVRFVGFLDDVRPLWQSADMAVYASEAEGLCTALVEAQGAGLPAVATRAGGMAEVVQDGATGFLAPVGSVEALASALEKLVEDAALRQRLGTAAAQRARNMFSVDAMVDGVARVYEELWTQKT